jgi:hypothetical protein
VLPVCVALRLPPVADLGIKVGGSGARARAALLIAAGLYSTTRRVRRRFIRSRARMTSSLSRTAIEPVHCTRGVSWARLDVFSEDTPGILHSPQYRFLIRIVHGTRLTERGLNWIAER